MFLFNKNRNILTLLFQEGGFVSLIQILLENEAAREKINHFLRKFILFFVSLFVTLFHFLKSDVTVAFILPITYDQLAACFTGFVSANRIGKLKLGNPKIFEQLPYIRMVVYR